MRNFIKQDDIRNIVINILAALVYTGLAGLGAQQLGLIQPLSLVFILVVGLGGTCLGWWFHYRRTQKIAFVYTEGFETDLSFLARSTRIDMIAITFRALAPFRNQLEEAISHHNAKIKVLLLDPACKNFQEFAKTPGQNLQVLKGESLKTVELLDELNKQLGASIEYKFYDCIPYSGYIITDSIVRYWPYLYLPNPSEAPIYHLAPTSKIAKTLEQNFRSLWNSARQQKQRSWTIQEIVTGGQTGADRAALDWAIEHQIPHGGWCSKGRQAEDGPLNTRYMLKETPSADSIERTEWNVRDSDGTVIFSLRPRLTGGSLSTLYFVAKYGKPCLHIHARVSTSDQSARLLAFLREHEIKKLNIAGPRASTELGVETFVTEILEQTFLAAKTETR